LANAPATDLSPEQIEELSEAIAGTPLTADSVAGVRTFMPGPEGNRARNIVTLNAWTGDPVTLAADFGIQLDDAPPALNDGTTLNSVTAVTVWLQSDPGTTVE